MKKVFCISFLIAIVTIGCRQAETTKTAPPLKNEVETMAIRVSAMAADASEPAVTADAEGNFYVVYIEHGAEKAADVVLQKYDSQKQPIGEKVRVNRQLGEATAWRGDPPTIVVGADKTVYVGWTKTVKTDAGSGRDLCLSVSRDGGQSFAAPIKVNDDTAPASHGMHSLAVGKNNEIYLTWLDERNVKSTHHAENFEPNSNTSEYQFVKIHHNSNETTETLKNEKQEASEPNSEVFFAVSNDGGRKFSANVKLSGEVCPCCKTSLAVAPDGRIYASWRQVLPGDFRHIAVASSNDSGKTFSVPTIVSDDRWKINACPVSGAALAIDKNNLLRIFWFTAGNAGKMGLYEAESNDLGATFSDRGLVSEGEVSGMPLLLPHENGTFRVFWESEEKIYQSHLTANRAFANAEMVSAGTLPAAVMVREHFLVVYVKKENGKRVIWLNEL